MRGKYLLVGMVLALLSVGAQTQTNGPYVKEQADKGESLFQQNCAMCHGSKLEGGGGPALSAATLYTDWGTADALFSMFSKAMPPQSPGQLKEDEYVNILAFILRFNGIPEGSSPLTSKLDDLKKIKFPKPN